MRWHLFLAALLLLNWFSLVGEDAIVVGQDATAGDREKAVDLLSKTIEHSGEQLFRAGEFTYEVASKGEVPTASEIAELNRQTAEQLLAASEAATDPEQKAYLKSLAEDDVNLGPSMIASADVKLQFYFAFDGPLIGGDRYLECRRWDAVSEGFGNVEYSLVRRYGAGKSDCVWLDQYLSGQVGPVEKIGAVQQAPHYLGRISGAIMSLGLEYMLARLDQIELAEGLEFDGQPAVEIRCRVKDFHTPGIAEIKYLVVPTMGYIVPSVQEYDSEGNIHFECESEDYFETADSSVMFPRKCVTTNLVDGKPRVESYTFEPGKVKINADVPGSRFKVEVPVGADLLLVNSGQNLIAHSVVEVGIDDIPGLPENPAFHAFGEEPPGHRPEPTASGFTSLLLLISAVLLLGAIGALLFFARRRGKAAIVLLVFSVGGVQSGCGSQGEQLTYEKLVDLGKVASEQQSVKFSFEVTNPSSSPISLSFAPACSCTVLKTDLTIEQGRTEQVEGILQLHGRSGPFESKIHMRRSNGPGRGDGDFVTIKALIVDHWAAVPRRVLTRPGGASSLRLIAPTASWEGVSVQPAGEMIQVRQISSHIDDARNEARDFEITVEEFDQVKRQGARIELRNQGEERPFLSVPVLVEDQSGLY